MLHIYVLEISNNVGLTLGGYILNTGLYLSSIEIFKINKERLHIPINKQTKPESVISLGKEQWRDHVQVDNVAIQKKSLVDYNVGSSFTNGRRASRFNHPVSHPLDRREKIISISAIDFLVCLSRSKRTCH